MCTWRSARSLQPPTSPSNQVWSCSKLGSSHGCSLFWGGTEEIPPSPVLQCTQLCTRPDFQKKRKNRASASLHHKWDFSHCSGCSERAVHVLPHSYSSVQAT
mmetsp:Transcript_67425/g.119542  ORF Transcript_67425/g.119542 Transcript_67425/m.119542 type:complete len:102 (-) Transcript_67425:162-467(-)